MYAPLFSPFSGGDPVWLLLWLSLATAVLVLLVYKTLSSQEAIRKAKERVKGHILEIRLFQDDPVLMGRAVRSVLAANLRYLALNVKPFLIVFLPVSLLLVQMEARLGYRPLRPNESVLLRTVWKPAQPGGRYPDPILLPGDGLSLESPPLRLGDGREIDWRLRADRMGAAGFVLTSAEGSVGLQVAVSEKIVPVSLRNVPAGSLEILWHPAGQPLPPNGSLMAAEIVYPRRDFRLLGRRIHWVWPYLGASLLAGVLLKGLFRVHF
jgi:hypothetical protein